MPLERIFESKDLLFNRVWVNVISSVGNNYEYIQRNNWNTINLRKINNTEINMHKYKYLCGISGKNDDQKSKSSLQNQY